MRSRDGIDFWGAVGLAFGLFIVCCAMGHYGKRWAFSEYGIPQTLLSPDGQRYRDGGEIDPLTRGLVSSGGEGAYCLGAIGVIGVCAVWTYRLCAETERKREYIAWARSEAERYAALRNRRRPDSPGDHGANS